MVGESININEVGLSGGDLEFIFKNTVDIRIDRSKKFIYDHWPWMVAVFNNLNNYQANSKELFKTEPQQIEGWNVTGSQ